MSKTGSYIGGHTVIALPNLEKQLEVKAVRYQKWLARAQLEYDKEREAERSRNLAEVEAFNRDPRKRTTQVGSRRRRQRAK